MGDEFFRFAVLAVGMVRCRAAMDDKRRMKEFRRRGVKGARLLKEDVAPAEVARRVGVSRQSVMRWEHAIETGGLECVVRLGARGRPRRLSDAMFFSSFPLSTSPAAIQVLVPKHLRAQTASYFLLISNIIGMGIGTTLVALTTDRYFHDARAVDLSVAIVIVVAASACLLLLGSGRRHYRASLAPQAEGRPEYAFRQP